MAASEPSIPVWVDLATPDPAGARAFYATVLGWEIEVTLDPQYGGYAMARVQGRDAAGIGPAQPGQPPAWTLYLGTHDADGLANRVAAHGGSVVMPPFTVGDVGRMGIVQDPSGAYFGLWQPDTMQGFAAEGHGAFTWAELNSRGFDDVLAFYHDAFGWAPTVMGIGDGRTYTRFMVEGHPVAGGQEMHPGIPEQVPSYWMIYFAVDDTQAAYDRAIAAGGREMLSPTPFPGGTLAILQDPAGAVFAIRSTVTG